jgi:hypothetical protein
MKGETNNELRPTALERPEAKDERVVRVSARFFALAAEESLTPYEMAVAWQRIARTILRESLWKISMGALLCHLAREIIEEMPTVPGLAEKKGGAA